MEGMLVFSKVEDKKELHFTYITHVEKDAVRKSVLVYASRLPMAVCKKSLAGKLKKSIGWHAE